MAFAVAAGAACLTKEHIGLVVAAIGLWYALARGRRRAGLVIAVGGAAVAVVAIAVVVPHFAPGGGSPFAGRYEAVGGIAGRDPRTAATEPGHDRPRARRSDATGGTLLDLLLPLGWSAAARARSRARRRCPNWRRTSSRTRTQTSIHFHYTAGAIPGADRGDDLRRGAAPAAVGRVRR